MYYVPATDGTWFWFEVDGGMMGDININMPCRFVSVTEDRTEHQMVTLECGTGGMMETHVIDLFSSARPRLVLWVGAEVTLRYVADPVWWVDRWLTIRDRGGNLILAATDASWLRPTTPEPIDWYAPVDVRLLGGYCPPQEETCGPRERQALYVTFGGERAIIFDGNSATVGSLVGMDVKWARLPLRMTATTCRTAGTRAVRSRPGRLNSGRPRP